MLVKCNDLLRKVYVLENVCNVPENVYVQEKLSGSERKKLQTLQPSSKNQALLVRVTLWLDDTHDDAHVYHDDDIMTHMMIDTNLTHGASPCLHGWEHMSARRCHLTKSNKQLLPSCCQSTSLANYVNNFERSNIVGYPHLNNQPIGASNQFCFLKICVSNSIINESADYFLPRKHFANGVSWTLWG